MTVRAIFNGTVIAESDHTVVVEGNQYFPPEDVHHEFLEPSDSRTHCPWKGQASYFTVVVGGRRNQDAAWYYPNPRPAASEIEGRIAFWRGIEIAQGEPSISARNAS